MMGMSMIIVVKVMLMITGWELSQYGLADMHISQSILYVVHTTKKLIVLMDTIYALNHVRYVLHNYCASLLLCKFVKLFIVSWSLALSE